MCVIIASETDRPSAESLESCAAQNRDGQGFSWVENGRVRWKKGVSVDELIHLSDNKPLPHVSHFRLATAGNSSLALTHPFPLERIPDTNLNGSAKRVLFHNGHWMGWKGAYDSLGVSRRKVDRWSDTRVLASVLSITNPDRIPFYAASAGKLAIMTPTGIQRYGDWHEFEGSWYSNTYWKWSSMGASYIDWDNEFYPHYNRRWEGYDDVMHQPVRIEVEEKTCPVCFSTFTSYNGMIMCVDCQAWLKDVFDKHNAPKATRFARKVG